MRFRSSNVVDTHFLYAPHRLSQFDTVYAETRKLVRAREQDISDLKIALDESKSELEREATRLVKQHNVWEMVLKALSLSYQSTLLLSSFVCSKTLFLVDSTGVPPSYARNLSV